MRIFMRLLGQRYSGIMYYNKGAGENEGVWRECRQRGTDQERYCDLLRR
jgi:hypothetical protein